MSRRLGVALAAVVLILAAAACGKDEPTDDDRETLRALLSSSAAVDRAMVPLYSCPPDEPRCYRDAGPRVVTVVERERAALAETLAATDDECLGEVGDLYGDSLAAYAEAGRAASAGRPAAVDRAIERSTEAEIAYLEKMGDCGFSQGRFREAGAEMRRIGVDVLRLTAEMDECASEACLVRVARRLEAAAREGVASIDPVLEELRAEEDVPACMPASLETMREAYGALVRMSSAFGKRDYEAAERAGARAATLGTRAQEDLAACLETLGE